MNEQVLHFLGDVGLLSLMLFCGIGIWVRINDEVATPQDIIGLVMLILIVATAWTAYVR